MEYTVQKLAKLAGVSSRTIRWYDEIGLLQPCGKTEGGYRLYGPNEVARLQQILFYREAGLPLEEIARLLDEPGYSPGEALRGHLRSLLEEKRRLDRLIANAKKTLHNIEGEIEMNDTERFEGFKKELVDKNEARYGAEIREKYGDEAVEESNRKMMNLTKEEYEAMQKTEEELRAVLAAAAGLERPDEELSQRAYELHKGWLGYTWPKYDPAAHRGLADMYEQDARFAEYYDKMAPGGAAFLCDAIRRNAK